MTRTLTVSTIEQPRKWRKIARLPAIRLAGAWLAKAGFEPGKKVNVTVEDNRLVITPAA